MYPQNDIPEEVYKGLEQAKQGLGRRLPFDLNDDNEWLNETN